MSLGHRCVFFHRCKCIIAPLVYIYGASVRATWALRAQLLLFIPAEVAKSISPGSDHCLPGWCHCKSPKKRSKHVCNKYMAALCSGHFCNDSFFNSVVTWQTTQVTFQWKKGHPWPIPPFLDWFLKCIIDLDLVLDLLHLGHVPMTRLKTLFSSLPLYYVLWTFSLYFYFILLFCVLLIGRFFYCCVPVQHFFQYQWPHWQGRNSYSVCLNSNNNNLRQQCLVYCVTLTNSILQENFFPFFPVRKVTFWDSTFCISAINMLNK